MILAGFRLHHVGFAVAQIAPAAADYVRRFGYMEETAILHDPLQTAFVQFLKLAGDASWLEFVAPDGPASLLAGAVKQGGGLNHLCYVTGPLEKAIARLEEEGLRLIREPQPAVAFAGRRVCWLLGQHRVPIELVERRDAQDACVPGL